MAYGLFLNFMLVGAGRHYAFAAEVLCLLVVRPAVR